MRTPDTIPELRDKDRRPLFSPVTGMLFEVEAESGQHTHQYNEPTYYVEHPPTQKHIPPTRSPNILLWCVAACIVWAGAYVLVFRPSW